ncbi:hypothetical protein [Mycolicibacterium bacteremicum]|uniref:hypothetical protein n=1 Tax=Mycolicibacterium bacteremicum TaxID=564198 RepID=UPI0026F2952B|nr:hypothetical protein [Mycolicibacterium bacteremicum]
MSVDADLDALYGVPPAEFTTRRKELVAAAKKRGDTEGAGAIAAARRPTAAAWVVNALVRHDRDARDRLADLRAQLRAAHAAMDGARIRELTAAQRTLVTELTRAGFAAAGVANPTAALRDDVTNTLQAAIADPDVAARLGRLEKAEEWSGFGDFGVSTAVGARRSTRTADVPAGRAAPDPDAESAAGERLRVLTDRRAAAAAALARAEQAHRAAGDSVADRRAALITARRHHEQVLELLATAEHDVDLADADLTAARQEQDMAESDVRRAEAELAAADSALQAVSGPSRS